MSEAGFSVGVSRGRFGGTGFFAGIFGGVNGTVKVIPKIYCLRREKNQTFTSENKKV
jgi:hypothetical protein